MIAFTPTPAKTEATIERHRTLARGYAPLMMFVHARLTASSRQMWQTMPSASAPQPSSPSRSRKTSVAFQIASNSSVPLRHGHGGRIRRLAQPSPHLRLGKREHGDRASARERG